MGTVRRGERGDAAAVGTMMALLWPEGTLEEHTQEAANVLLTGKCGTLPAAILLAVDEKGKAVGFLQVGLRSHADGCDVEHAVGFVEGWFVQADARGCGVGGELMRAAEAWARAQGCVEMASDALIDNQASQRAHRTLGFEVVDRCVHFRKKL
ncbi:MAG: GNAT family N-acetyltransferase [Terracidiphilus sp.]